ncbi:hypothetical protein BDY19DRAFT_990604 [Irpex rosettiformis]|uniref:Uncharacterized protein n=1 Tax=Irpex rosettiformis TaxID=378272 RepID=A0ACB8UC32_9APHY|nr:hypothetical protein BDY19DRAFT_990604 [Irpex rosettiformis]
MSMLDTPTSAGLASDTTRKQGASLFDSLNTTRHNLKPEWGPLEHLAYYSEPSIPTDLAWGRELFLKKNRHNRWVAHPAPLEYLVQACIALGKEAELSNADVITWRGLLVKLMAGKRVDIKFYNVNDTLYLVEYDPKPHYDASLASTSGRSETAITDMGLRQFAPGQWIKVGIFLRWTYGNALYVEN